MPPLAVRPGTAMLALYKYKDIQYAGTHILVVQTINLCDRRLNSALLYETVYHYHRPPLSRHVYNENEFTLFMLLQSGVVL